MSTIPRPIYVGLTSICVSIMAIFIGQTLEKIFSNKSSKITTLFQLGATSMVYFIIKRVVYFPAEAWVVFASSVFAGQPTLMPRLRNLLNLA